MQRRDFFKTSACAVLVQSPKPVGDPLRIGFAGPEKREKEYRSSAGTLASVRWVAAERAQAVIVASPLERRAKDALAQLRAGRHVLIEPPVSILFKEFDPLVGEANARNLRIGAAYPLRYAPHCIRAREILRSASIGRVQSVRIEASDIGEAASSYLGQAAHLLDLPRWLFGAALVSVTARSDPEAAPAQRAGALRLQVSYQGPRVTYDAGPSGSTPPGGWTLTVAGASASLRLTGTGQLLEMRDGSDWAQLPVPSAPDALSLLVADFAEACRTGREPETNAVDGMAGVGLLTGAVASARSGSTSILLHNHYQLDLDDAFERQSRAAGKRN
jgi:predicted dehydrogenase